MSILTNKMLDLTENVTLLILSKLEEGWSIRRVAHYYNIVKSTVQRIKQVYHIKMPQIFLAGVGGPSDPTIARRKITSLLKHLELAEKARRHMSTRRALLL
jgi:hypothetical protein